MLLGGSLVMLLYGLSQASVKGGFTEATVLPWLIGGTVCLLVFAGYSLVRRDAAVVNVRLFADPTFAASCLLMFVVAIALFGGLLLLPLYYQVVRGLGVGATMMPVFAAAYRRLPRERVPQAATTLSALVQVGGSFGTAALVLALTRQIADNFAAHGLATRGTGTGQLSAL